ncbi:hypothetical protein GPECTOR_20g503 [Gonium pectorale]|uniref:SAP domain-containing protein n=1 Tax=Gonium pectorale TaxID=33097 RepID=A0A150GIK9_GONPE|nr:hypothetical protein GPECTOR_20g503 [Gonium pectorale]|eukprot:KXZ49646.1 hypothetical protein GPECTOR_20g503 [Gonium pectorale]
MVRGDLRLWAAAAQEPGPLIRLVVPVAQGTSPFDDVDDGESAKALGGKLAALRLAASLRALQPGGPCSCWAAPSLQTITIVVVGKTNAAVGYKALSANAAKLGFKLGDVKSTVVVAAMGPDDLQRTAEAAVGHALRARGWHRLGAMWVRCNCFEVPPGRPALVPATQLAVRHATGAALALDFREAGMYKFSPLSPLPPEPVPAAAAPVAAGAGPGAGSGHASGQATGAMTAAEAWEAAEAQESALAALFADRAARRRALARLSDTRITVVGPGVSAYVVGIKPLPASPAAVRRLRDAWLARFGLELPERLGGWLAEVGAHPEADPDDAREVPGCCVWAAVGGGGSGGGGGGEEEGGWCGLAPAPPGQCAEGAEQVAEQLMADLTAASASCFAFWGPGGLTSRREAPPGAQAALEKRLTGSITAAAAAAASAKPPAAATAAAAAATGPQVMGAAGGGDGGGGDGAAGPIAAVNTGWTAAREVVASGFRTVEALPPASRAILKKMMDGGGGEGGGSAGGLGFALSAAEAAEAAEAAYGDQAAGGGGGAGSAAAREAMLQRSSDEALRAAAERRAASRAKEQGVWANIRAYQRMRKARHGCSVSAAAALGRMGDLMLPEMQCWLRARKAPVSGKKADVEARLAGLLGLAAPAPAATVEA